jgi:hypothetical protein
MKDGKPSKIAKKSKKSSKLKKTEQEKLKLKNSKLPLTLSMQALPHR